MSAIESPSLDYKRFLSNAGSGLVAFVSLAIVVYICGTNNCRFELIRDLYECVLTTFPSSGDDIIINNIALMIIIIIFISLMIGFIVDAISYVLLDNLIYQIADCVYFQKILKRLGSVSYYDVAEFRDHFDSISDHFNPKKRLPKFKSECKSNCEFAKCLDEITTRVSIERPKIVEYWGDVRGGYIMFRNFLFILLFCLFFIFLSFWNLSQILQDGMVLLIMIIFLVKLTYKCSIISFLSCILLTVLVPLLIASLPITHDPSGFIGLSNLGLGTIVVSIISLNMLFFLSAFVLTYYHYHIFIVAMYISSDESWKLPCTDQIAQ